MNYTHAYIKGGNAKNGKTQFSWKDGIKMNLLAYASTAEFAFLVNLFE